MSPDDPRQRDMEHVRARAQSPEQFAALTEAMVDRQRQPGWFVVLGRQKELPPPDHLAAFARAHELDVYTARQRLIAPTPRILRRFDTEKPAAEWADWLRAISLRAFAVSEEVLGQQQFVPVAAVYAQQGQLVIDDLKNQRTTVPMDKACAIVIGEVVEKRFAEHTSSNIMADDLTFQRDNLGHRVEIIIDIHLRHTPMTIRVAQDSFQFQRLYPDRQGATSVLVRELFKRLCEALPGAAVYDDFKRAENILGTSERLIASSTYLKFQAGRLFGIGPVGVAKQHTRLESNADTFNIYSTLARLETLKT